MSNKTPRVFRNALYEELVVAGAEEEDASAIAAEAELYAQAFEAFKLRDITFAMDSLGMSSRQVQKAITRNLGESLDQILITFDTRLRKSGWSRQASLKAAEEAKQAILKWHSRQAGERA